MYIYVYIYIYVCEAPRGEARGRRRPPRVLPAPRRHARRLPGLGGLQAEAVSARGVYIYIYIYIYICVYRERERDVGSKYLHSMMFK